MKSQFWNSILKYDQSWNQYEHSDILPEYNKNNQT